MKELTAHGVVRGGKLFYDGYAEFAAAIEKLPDGPFTQTLEQYDERLDQMWKWYYAAIVPPGMEKWGYETKEDMHDAWKRRHNPKPIHDFETGEIVMIGKSTKKMPKAQQVAFVEACLRDLANAGIYVQEPSEYKKLKGDGA